MGAKRTIGVDGRRVVMSASDQEPLIEPVKEEPDAGTNETNDSEAPVKNKTCRACK